MSIIRKLIFTALLWLPLAAMAQDPTYTISAVRSTDPVFYIVKYPYTPPYPNAPTWQNSRSINPYFDFGSLNPPPNTPIEITGIKSGDEITLEIAEPNPSSCEYTFKSWTVTKNKGGTVTVANNKFTMPDDDVKIEVAFDKGTCPIGLSPIWFDEYPAGETYKVTVDTRSENSSIKDEYVYFPGIASGKTVSLEAPEFITKNGQRYKFYRWNISNTNLNVSGPSRTITPTYSDPNKHFLATFTMPSDPVRISAAYLRVYDIVVSCVPAAACNSTALKDYNDGLKDNYENYYVSLSAPTPIDGYRFKRWSGNADFNNPTDKDTYIYIEKKVTLTATFEDVYELTLDCDDGSCGITSDNSSPYGKDDAVTLSASSIGNGSKVFKQWLCGPKVAFNPGATSPTARITVTGFTAGEDITCAAEYEDLDGAYAITVNLGEGGSYEGPNKISSSGTLTAKPFKGYKFAGWSNASGFTPAVGYETIVALSISAPTGNVSVGLTFEPIDYKLTIIAKPVDGAESIEVDIDNSGNPTTISSGGEVNVPFRADVFIFAPEAAGYEFREWSIDNKNDISLVSSKNSSDTYLKMPAEAVTLTANYNLREYYVYADLQASDNYYHCANESKITGHVVEKVSDDYTYYENILIPYKSSVELKAVPAQGCKFDGWDFSDANIGASNLTSGTAASATIKFNMPAEDVGGIVAKFSRDPSAPLPIKQTIYAWNDDGAGGTFNTSNPKTAMPGTQVTLRVSANKCSTFEEWYAYDGNGFSQSSSETFITFTMPNFPVEANASFVATPNCTITNPGGGNNNPGGGNDNPGGGSNTPSVNYYSVRVSSTTGGTAYANRVSAANGDIVVLTAEPSEGYRFKEWIVKSGSISISPSATFTMPSSLVSVEAVFESLSVSPTIARISAHGSVMANAINGGILLQNLPQNAKVEVYNLHGKRIYSANSENSQILKILVQTKGMYIIKVNSNAMRIAVK